MKFKIRPYGMALLGVALSLGIIGQASATPEFCPSPGGVPAGQIYNSTAGTEGFPGTNVGTASATVAVGNVCQIGIVNPKTGSDVALINSAEDPTNYEFAWAGGFMDIEEMIGASSFGNADAELDSWNGSTATLVSGASIEMIGNTSTPSAEYMLFNGQLAAGNYIVSTYCSEKGCLTNDGTAVDPQFQINFLVPEPSSFAVLAASLAGLARFVRRRKA
jgi:hypothetical protein